MDDDFNSPSGLAVLFEIAKELRSVGNVITHQGKSNRDSSELRQEWQTLVCLAQVLGLETQPEATVTGNNAANTTAEDAEIEAMIAARREARQAKNFAESDRLRDLLKAQDITLIDQPDGTTRWHRG
jgi:cysteinyl-tRNA synthetase